MGTLTPHVRSAALPPAPRAAPEGGEGGGVGVVTARTFKEVVEDGTKDVVLQLDAPMCGRCEVALQHWRDVADKVRARLTNL